MQGYNKIHIISYIHWNLTKSKISICSEISCGLSSFKKMAVNKKFWSLTWTKYCADLMFMKDTQEYFNYLRSPKVKQNPYMEITPFWPGTVVWLHGFLKQFICVILDKIGCKQMQLDHMTKLWQHYQKLSPPAIID